MCGRYVLFTDEEADDITDIVRELQRTLAMEAEMEREQFVASGEIFPTQRVPVVTAEGPTAMVWGLPMQPKSGAIINARAESAYEKPMFRSAMQTRRCVVPSHGFFEWRKRPDGTKEKLLFRFPGESTVLFMAGLYNMYPEGRRFAILTTAANDAMRPIHHRMPVVLQPSEWRDYLGDGQAARALVGRVPPALRSFTV